MHLNVPEDVVTMASRFPVDICRSKCLCGTVSGGVKALGALGFANMWEAVFADVGVSVIAILNDSRALRVNQ